MLAGAANAALYGLYRASKRGGDFGMGKFVIDGKNEGFTLVHGKRCNRPLHGAQVLTGHGRGGGVRVRGFAGVFRG